MVGRFRAQNHPGGAVFLGTQGGREGGRYEEGRSKGAGREEGGRMQEEGREERGRREGGRRED